MPDGTDKTPPDSGAGTGAAGAAGAGTGAPPTPPEPPKKLDLTQDDLDRIIVDRVKRAIPADYDELKTLKTARDAAAEQEKTDLQKAQDAAKKSDERAEKAIATANGRLIRAEIITAAAAAGAVDTEIVAALLTGLEDIAIDKDGVVTGAKEAVAKLLKDKPFLKKSASGATHGEFGGNDPKTKAAQIAELEQKAMDPKLTAQQRQKFYAEARALKLGVA